MFMLPTDQIISLLVKGAVCKFLALLKHKNTLICQVNTLIHLKNNTEVSFSALKILSAWKMSYVEFLQFQERTCVLVKTGLARSPLKNELGRLRERVL